MVFTCSSMFPRNFEATRFNPASSSFPVSIRYTHPAMEVSGVRNSCERARAASCGRDPSAFPPES